MRRFRALVCAVAVAVAAVPAARADSFDIVLPANVLLTADAGTQSNAQTFTVAGPALTNVLGYSFRGNWTLGSGDPWSGELRVAVTAPGLAATNAAFVGGANNGNPFAFPGTNSTGNLFAPLGGPPTSTPAGNFQATVSSIDPGVPSTINLANPVVTVYHSPTTEAGDTTAGATFNRPTLSGTALSGTGTAVRYVFSKLTVNESGIYMIAQGTPGHDGFFVLYANAFNPAAPLANFVGGGDDDVGLDGVLVNQLNAGTDYFLVSTGFANTDFGAYTTFAAGPGVVTLTPVPEPACGLAAAAFVAAGWRRLRRR